MDATSETETLGRPQLPPCPRALPWNCRRAAGRDAEGQENAQPTIRQSICSYHPPSFARTNAAVPVKSRP